MMQIVDYLESGQEKMTYPDREAKFIRNHHFMTQLEFFDLQEDQERAWEGEQRKKEAEQVPAEQGTSAALVAAAAAPSAPPAPSGPAPPGGGSGADGAGGADGAAGGLSNGGPPGGKGDKREPPEQDKKDPLARVSPKLHAPHTTFRSGSGRVKGGSGLLGPWGRPARHPFILLALALCFSLPQTACSAVSKTNTHAKTLLEQPPYHI